MSFRLSLSHSVAEQHVHIVEPVAKQVLQYIIERLGYLDFFRENGNIDMVSEFTGTSKAVDKNGNPEIHHNRVRAKLNWNLNPQTVKWQGNGTTIDLGNGNHLVTNATPVSHRQAWARESYAEHNASIMSDVKAYTDLVEYSVGSTLTMEVQMDFKDDAMAFECFTRIFQCFQNGEMIGYVDVQYDYPIPYALQNTYAYICNLMGYSDWHKAIIDNSGGNITYVQNRNAPERKELVVKKNHFQAIYQIECSQEAPTPAEPDGASITLNITVQFSRANRMMLKWPIIVNNQFVDFKYVPTDPAFRICHMPSPVMWRNHAVTGFWKSQYPNRLRPVHYPWWDDWDLPSDSVQAMRGFIPIAIVAFCLDDVENENGETVIDLVHGLPGMKLNDDIVRELMIRPGRELLLPNRYVNVAVFAEDYQLGTPTQIEDNIKPMVELNRGKLIVRARRPYTQFRLVISVNPKPVNLTAKPISTEVYPSRWYDLTAPSYINTKDSIVNTGKRYFWYDTVRADYIEIPTTEGEPIADVYNRLAQCEDIYILSGNNYVPTTDTTITQGVTYYTYDISVDSYRAAGYPVGTPVSNIRAKLAEAGCVYEYRDAFYGESIIADDQEYVGYTVCTDKEAKYDTVYYVRNEESHDFDPIENLKFGDPLPTDQTIYTKDNDSKKFYINKTEVDPFLGNRMREIALSMTSDNVTLPVYEEVEIPAGTPIAEVKETLGVTTLYTDNEKAVPDEPITTLTTENEHYVDSYKGYNAARVFQVTFVLRKRKS